MVSVRVDVASVKNLYDTSTGSVMAFMEQQGISLSPGAETLLVVAPSEREATDLVWEDGTARLNVRVVHSDGNKQILLSDFSHVDIMHNDDLLKAVRHSGNGEAKTLSRQA